MEVNEVRVGNKVDLYGSIATICESDYSTGLAIIEGKPILLTKEWLVDFGFSVDRYESVYKYKKIEWLSIYKNGFFLQKPAEDNYWSTFLATDTDTAEKVGYIKYVHELQNLYFALMDIELKLK